MLVQSVVDLKFVLIPNARFVHPGCFRFGGLNQAK